MRKLSLFASIIGLIAITSCNQADKEVSKQFNDFLDRKFEEGLMRNPEFASSLGLNTEMEPGPIVRSNFMTKNMKLQK